MVARNEMDAIRERLATTERNQSDLAKTVTEVVNHLNETRDDVAALKTNEAVNVAYEKARDEWRQRTEKKLDGIYSLGWWVLATFGSLTVAAVANILYGGGGNGP
jgi:DNA repair ATPase RecN